MQNDSANLCESFLEEHFCFKFFVDSKTKLFLLKVFDLCF